MGYVIDPKEVVAIVKASYHNAKCSIEDKTVKGSPFRRFSVKTELSGSIIVINCGENMVLLIDNVPREVFKHLSLAHPNTAKAEIQLWMKNIKDYLKIQKPPEVKTLARKYLGKENKVVKKNNGVFIYYDKFYLVITPNKAMFILSSTKRVVNVQDINTEEEIELFFGNAKYHEENINKGVNYG